MGSVMEKPKKYFKNNKYFMLCYVLFKKEE